jgi:hypothetical protein
LRHQLYVTRAHEWLICALFRYASILQRRQWPIVSSGGVNFRSTKDLDLEGFLQDEAEVVREVFAFICAQPVEDDGLIFDASRN